MARFVTTRDRRIFDALFVRYRAKVVAHAGRYVSDQRQAEELAQEVFIRVYTAKAYRARGSFRAWLYRVATNVCLSELRRSKVESVLSTEHRLEWADDSRSPDAMAEERELRHRLEGTLAALPETQRAAFVLAHHEGLSYEEVAEALTTTVPAVKALVHRALCRMREDAADLLSPAMEEA